MFILLWAVSGHHYLTLQRESCKQMLVAHSVVIACAAVAAERTGVVEGVMGEAGMGSKDAGGWKKHGSGSRRCGNPESLPELRLGK